MDSAGVAGFPPVGLSAEVTTSACFAVCQIYCCYCTDQDLFKTWLVPLQCQALHKVEGRHNCLSRREAIPLPTVRAVSSLLVLAVWVPGITLSQPFRAAMIIV